MSSTQIKMSDSKNLEIFKKSLVKSMCKVLEKKSFKNIKANIENTPFGKPKTIFGITPDLTAMNEDNKFHIVGFAMTDAKDSESLEKLKAFGKYAKLHQANYWLVIRKQAEEQLAKKIKKLELDDYVQLKALPAMEAIVDGN